MVIEGQFFNNKMAGFGRQFRVFHDGTYQMNIGFWENGWCLERYGKRSYKGKIERFPNNPYEQYLMLGLQPTPESQIPMLI